MRKKMRAALATASVLAATGATAMLGAGAAHASGNGGAYVAGAWSGWGNGTIDTCPSGDVCVYTEPNYQGKMWAFGDCRNYKFYYWNGTGSWVNNQTIEDSYNTKAKVYGGDGGRIDTWSVTYPYFDSSYNFEPVYSVTPCSSW